MKSCAKWMSALFVLYRSSSGVCRSNPRSFSTVVWKRSFLYARNKQLRGEVMEPDEPRVRTCARLHAYQSVNTMPSSSCEPAAGSPAELTRASARFSPSASLLGAPAQTTRV
jgi:hypothetical protein